jgi:hypothetical protein
LQQFVNGLTTGPIEVWAFKGFRVNYSKKLI